METHTPRAAKMDEDVRERERRLTHIHREGESRDTRETHSARVRERGR